MTHVTCRLTAKNRDQLRNPTLGNRVWLRLPFYLLDKCIRTNVKYFQDYVYQILLKLVLRPSYTKIMRMWRFIFLRRLTFDLSQLITLSIHLRGSVSQRIAWVHPRQLIPANDMVVCVLQQEEESERPPSTAEITEPPADEDEPEEVADLQQQEQDEEEEEEMDEEGHQSRQPSPTDDVDDHGRHSQPYSPRAAAMRPLNTKLL